MPKTVIGNRFVSSLTKVTSFQLFKDECQMSMRVLTALSPKWHKYVTAIVAVNYWLTHQYKISLEHFIRIFLCVVGIVWSKNFASLFHRHSSLSMKTFRLSVVLVYRVKSIARQKSISYLYAKAIHFMCICLHLVLMLWKN